jgi:energy-coupling factor transporter ATP-binding protein EcfA2
VRAEGHEVLGATILRRGPIGAVNLRFRDGVTALYGKNGAGKSVLLRNLEAVLDGDAAPWDEDNEITRCIHVRITDPEGVLGCVRPQHAGRRSDEEFAVHKLCRLMSVL